MYGLAGGGIALLACVPILGLGRCYYKQRMKDKDKIQAANENAGKPPRFDQVLPAPDPGSPREMANPADLSAPAGEPPALGLPGSSADDEWRIEPAEGQGTPRELPMATP